MRPLNAPPQTRRYFPAIMAHPDGVVDSGGWQTFTENRVDLYLGRYKHA